MKLEDLVLILRNALEVSKPRSLLLSQLQNENLTKTAAYKRYGRSNVDRWIREGLLKISHRKIDRVSLETVAASSNRRSYLPTTERH